MQVGTRGTYLSCTGGDSTVASEAGSPGFKSNVSSEWMVYTNERSPSYPIEANDSERGGKRKKYGEGSKMSDGEKEGLENRQRERNRQREKEEREYEHEGIMKMTTTFFDFGCFWA